MRTREPGGAVTARVVLPGDSSPGGRGDGKRRGDRGVGSPRLWSLLAWVGFVLAAMGAVDVGLTWYPLDFGSTEWEFGTVTQSFNGLPSVTMGLALWLVGALALDRHRLAMALAIAFLALGVLVIGAAIVYATTVPIALGSVEGPVRAGLQKAIAKTTLQSLAYPTVFIVVGVKGLRAARGGDSRTDRGKGAAEEKEEQRDATPEGKWK